jgi:excisionase family DNA binding protein
MTVVSFMNLPKFRSVCLTADLSSIARAGDEPAAEPPAPGGRARPARAAPGEPPAEREYLTPGEVARILHVSPKTINRWATDKLIPCIVTLGGHRRFRREDVLAVSARMSGGVDQRPGS